MEFAILPNGLFLTSNGKNARDFPAVWKKDDFQRPTIEKKEIRPFN